MEDFHLTKSYIDGVLKDECYYNSNNIDCLSVMILKIINYQKKIEDADYYVKKIGYEKIIYIWYPMMIAFNGKNYKVPILVFIMKNIPFEAPLFFVRIPEGSQANSSNKNIIDQDKFFTKLDKRFKYYKCHG